MISSLFAQLNRRFADRKLDEVISKLVAQVPPLKRATMRARVATSESATVDLDRLLTEYTPEQITEINRLMKTSTVSNRAIDSLFVKFAHIHPVFRRSGPDENGYYHYSENPDDPEFNYRKSYERQMSKYRKIGFDTFSRGPLVEAFGLKISVRKIRMYGWMIFNGVLEFAEKHVKDIIACNFERKTVKPSVAGHEVKVEPFPSFILEKFGYQDPSPVTPPPAAKRRRIIKNGHVRSRSCASTDRP
jgi:hypothetical protein